MNNVKNINLINIINIMCPIFIYLMNAVKEIKHITMAKSINNNSRGNEKH